MRTAAAMAALALGGCAFPGTGEPAPPVAGLQAVLRSEQSTYQRLERIVFELELLYYPRDS